MIRLELILISVLQFEALISGKIIYHRPGEDAVLPCAIASSSDPTCRLVSWFYNRDPSQDNVQVKIGNASSVPAARLSVDTACSLVIKSVTAEDVGLYKCQHEGRVSEDVYLNVLTISPSRPMRDGEVTLDCTLWRHVNLRPCRLDGLNWLDEKRTMLRGKGPGHHSHRQRKCASTLTVERPSGHNRRYTCQFVDSRDVTIEAEYTPDFTSGTTSGPAVISGAPISEYTPDFTGGTTSGPGKITGSPPDSTGWSPLSFVMLALRIGGLVLMIVITVVVIRNRWNKKPLDDDKVNNDDGGVQYENVEAPRAAATRV